MELPARHYGNTRVLSVSGRIGHDNAEAFRVALEPHLARCSAHGEALVLDLSGLEYISSAGLRVLMLAAREAKRNGGRIAVAALQPVVQEIFEISRFTLVFETFPTVREAVALQGAEALAAYDDAGA